MATADELLELKNKIDSAKPRLSELKGVLKTKKKELKDVWGFDVIEEAEIQITKWDEQYKKLTAEIRKEAEKIEDALDELDV